MTELNAYVAGCTEDLADEEFPEFEDIMHAVLLQEDVIECPVCYAKHYACEGNYLGNYLWFSCYMCGAWFHAID